MNFPPYGQHQPLHLPNSTTLPILDANDNIPPPIIKSLTQHDVAGRRLPHAVVIVDDRLREVGHGRETDDPVRGLVVVARVDARVLVAAQAGAAPAARLVAEGRLGRVVAPQVGDAVLDGALVGVLVGYGLAADDVRLRRRGILVSWRLLPRCSY